MKVNSETALDIKSSEIFEIFSAFLKSEYNITTIQHEKIYIGSEYNIIVKMKDLPNLKINNYGEFDQIRFYNHRKGTAHATWEIEDNSPARISFVKIEDDLNIRPVFFCEFAILSQVYQFLNDLKKDIVYDENSSLVQKLKEIDSILEKFFTDKLSKYEKKDELLNLLIDINSKTTDILARWR